MLKTFKKDPQAILDYQFNWTKWLGADVISTSSWTVPSGLVEDSNSNDGAKTTVWLSSGTAGTLYEVTNHITTAAGRQEDRSFIIDCQER